MSKRPVKPQHSLLGEIIGVAFIAAAFLVMASIWGLRLGPFGEPLEKILRYAFGRGAILFALWILCIGLRYIWRPTDKVFTLHFFAATALACNFLVLFHNFIAPANSELLPEYLPQGGGLMGGGLLFLARKFLGIDGSLIFFLATAVCLVIVTFTWSLKKSVLTATKAAEEGANGAISVVTEAGRKLKDAPIFDYEKYFPSSSKEKTPELFLPEEVEAPPVIRIESEPPVIRTESLRPAQARKAAPTFIKRDSDPGGYRYPYPELMTIPAQNTKNTGEAEAAEQARVLEQTLADFKVNARIVNVVHGPSVTRFEVEPAPGVKVNRIASLVDDLTLKLAAPGIRIETSIPGKTAMGIEVPKKTASPVFFYDVITSREFIEQEAAVAVALGKDITGRTIVADIGKMPHLLVAGSTGSGKSVCINTIVNSILFKASPEQVKFIMVDPKVVELSTYNGIPHLLTPVVTNPKKAAAALFWAVEEMERRYQLFAETGVREIGRYNTTVKEQQLPYIVIIIDELADLMMVAPGDVEDAICRLAQKARAAGLHLILATQRPSVDVITGIIKANIPSRIAFAVSSQIDSRTILDRGGAEKLLGKGDMLYYPSGMSNPLRVQGAFISDDDIENITNYIKNQEIPVQYNDKVTDHELPGDKPGKNSGEQDLLSSEQDELLLPALDVVMQTGQASASMLQRRMRIGYTRAARLIDSLESFGIIGPPTGTSKPRDILLSTEEAIRRLEEERSF